MNIINKLCIFRYFNREEGSSCLGHSTKTFQNGNCLTYTYPQPDSETDKNVRLDNIQDPNRSFPFAVEGKYCVPRIYLWIDRVPVIVPCFLSQLRHKLGKGEPWGVCKAFLLSFELDQDQAMSLS